MGSQYLRVTQYVLYISFSESLDQHGEYSSLPQIILVEYPQRGAIVKIIPVLDMKKAI